MTSGGSVLRIPDQGVDVRVGLPGGAAKIGVERLGPEFRRRDRQCHVLFAGELADADPTGADFDALGGDTGTLAIAEIEVPSRRGIQKCDAIGTGRSGSAKGAKSPFLRNRVSSRRLIDRRFSRERIRREPVLSIFQGR